jgi:hypothetical protein
MTAAQDFGDALRRYRGPVSRRDLATCLISQQNFHPPTVRDADDLANHLADIEAGKTWPFTRNEFFQLCPAVKACLPRRPQLLEIRLKITEALYSAEIP